MEVLNQNETQLCFQGPLLAFPRLHVAKTNFNMAGADRKIHRGFIWLYSKINQLGQSGYFWWLTVKS